MKYREVNWKNPGDGLNEPWTLWIEPLPEKAGPWEGLHMAVGSGLSQQRPSPSSIPHSSAPAPRILGKGSLAAS